MYPLIVFMFKISSTYGSDISLNCQDGVLADEMICNFLEQGTYTLNNVNQQVKIVIFDRLTNSVVVAEFPSVYPWSPYICKETHLCEVTNLHVVCLGSLGGTFESTGLQLVSFLSTNFSRL